MNTFDGAFEFVRNPVRTGGVAHSYLDIGTKFDLDRLHNVFAGVSLVTGYWLLVIERVRSNQ